MSMPTTQQPKAKSRKDFFLKGPGLILTLAAAGVVIGVLAVIGQAMGYGGGSVAKDITVSVTSCEMDGEGSLSSAKVGLQVQNTGSTTRSVRVEVEYRDGGGRRIDTDSAYVRDVAPGDTVAHEETTLLNAAPSGTGTCAITSIS